MLNGTPEERFARYRRREQLEHRLAVLTLAGMAGGVVLLGLLLASPALRVPIGGLAGIAVFLGVSWFFLRRQR